MKKARYLKIALKENANVWMKNMSDELTFAFCCDDTVWIRSKTPRITEKHANFIVHENDRNSLHTVSSEVAKFAYARDAHRIDFEECGKAPPKFISEARNYPKMTQRSYNVKPRLQATTKLKKKEMKRGDQRRQGNHHLGCVQRNETANVCDDNYDRTTTDRNIFCGHKTEQRGTKRELMVTQNSIQYEDVLIEGSERDDHSTDSSNIYNERSPAKRCRTHPNNQERSAKLQRHSTKRRKTSDEDVAKQMNRDDDGTRAPERRSKKHKLVTGSAMMDRDMDVVDAHVVSDDSSTDEQILSHSAALRLARSLKNGEVTPFQSWMNDQYLQSGRHQNVAAMMTAHKSMSEEEIRSHERDHLANDDYLRMQTQCSNGKPDLPSRNKHVTQLHVNHATALRVQEKTKERGDVERRDLHRKNTFESLTEEEMMFSIAESLTKYPILERRVVAEYLRTKFALNVSIEVIKKDKRFKKAYKVVRKETSKY